MKYTIKINEMGDMENTIPIELELSLVGEGVVYSKIMDNNLLSFKVKGEKHQSSKIKKLATVDIEQLNTINEFVEYSVTESRLLQGIDKMNEMSIKLEMKSTPHYLRWIFNDIIKEETDTLVKNGIDIKKIGSAISNKARIFWIDYLKKNDLF